MIDFSSPKRRFLFGAFVLALLPRLWALNWAMPLKTGHIDEGVVVFYALRAAAGDPDPRVFFDYPALFLYALAALFKALLLLGGLFGGGPAPAGRELLDAYMRGDGMSYLLTAARLLSAVAGALTGAVAARLAYARWGKWAAATAALLWAVNPLALRHAHYATVDGAAALLTLLALERGAAFADGGARVDALWSALWIGLGAATKYYPALLLPWLLAAAWLAPERRLATAALAVLTAAAAYAAASPYTLLAAPRFAERFLHIFGAVVGERPAGVPVLWPTLTGLWRGLTPAVALLAAGGLVACFRRPLRRGDAWLASAALCFIGFVGFWRVQAPHYALAAYPVLVGAAGAAVALAAARGRRWGWALLALAVGSSAVPAWRTLRLLSAPDTRLAALAFARDVFPAGSRVLRFSHTPEFTPRDPFRVSVDWENRRLAAGPEALEAGDADYVIYATYSPAADPVPDALARRFRLLRRFDAPAPDFPHHPAVSVYQVNP